MSWYFLNWQQNIQCQQVQYYACWCPGTWHHQVINRNYRNGYMIGIDNVKWSCSYLLLEWISTNLLFLSLKKMIKNSIYFLNNFQPVKCQSPSQSLVVSSCPAPRGTVAGIYPVSWQWDVFIASVEPVSLPVWRCMSQTKDVLLWQASRECWLQPLPHTPLYPATPTRQPPDTDLLTCTARAPSHWQIRAWMSNHIHGVIWDTGPPTNFRDFKHGLIEKVHRSSSHFIGQGPRTDGFPDVCTFHFLCGCGYLSLCPQPSTNSLAPGRSGCDFKNVIFNLLLLIGLFKFSWGNALRWMPEKLNKSTLAQVMACCLTAQSHHLSQGWLSSLSPCGVTRPQWVKNLFCVEKLFKTAILWKWLADGFLDDIFFFYNRSVFWY